MRLALSAAVPLEFVQKAMGTNSLPSLSVSSFIIRFEAINGVDPRPMTPSISNIRPKLI